MGKEIIDIGNIEVEKQIFHQHKSPFFIFDVYVNKTMVSNKVLFGKKKF